MNDLVKRSGAGALFTDDQGNILIVKPTYKDGWLFPGGIIESNETPSEACRREVKEELGLDRGVEKLLCVDYGKQDNETVTYLFRGGQLSQEEIERISLPSAELSEFIFVSEKVATELLRPKGARRLSACIEALRNGETIYLENGLKLELGNNL